MLGGCVAAAATPQMAQAGSGASMAAPAVVPSIFKPTGEIAKVCDVVAMGREDVCLEPKKMISAYDGILLERALDEWRGRIPGTAEAPVVVALLEAVIAADWDTCADLTKLNFPKEKALRLACQKRDGPAAVKAVLDLAKKVA